MKIRVINVFVSKSHFFAHVLALILFQIFLLLQPLAQAEEMLGGQRVLKSASELDYPPFAIVQPDGTAGGFSVDLLKAAAEAAGYSVVFKVGPWHELKQELADNLLDVLPLVSYSPERDKIYDFTAPYLNLNGTVFVRSGNTEIKDISDLKGKEVLVMRGDTAYEYVTANKLSENIIPTNTYEEAFKLLAAGKHDAVVVQQIVGLQIIQKLKIKNVAPVQKKNVSTLKPTALELKGFEQKFCFAVQKGNKQLLSRLNEGLTVTYLNGTYNTLYEKWFSPILPKPHISAIEFFKKLLFIIVPLLLIFTFFGVWYLKRLVNQKTSHLEQEIQQRKRIENELQDANAKYIKAQKTGKVGNWEFDFRTEKLSGSIEAIRIFGLNANTNSFTTEIVGNCIVEKERASQALADLIKNDTPINLEYDIITANSGERRTIHSLADLERDESGYPLMVRGVIQDITERRHVEDALRESEQRHRTYLMNTPYGVFVTDEKGRYLQVNPSACRITGYEESELLAMSIPDLFFKENLEEGMMHFQKLIQQGESTGELIFCTKSGEKRWWSVTAVKISDTRFLGFCNDITERKRAEAALIASEERLREAQKMADVGNWEFDIATKTIWASDRAFEIYGLNPFTKNTMEIAAVEACIRDREKVHQALVDLIEKDTPYNIEIEVHPANGFPPQFVHSIAKCTRTMEGSPQKVIGILQNITERKKAENEKLKLEAQLLQAQKMEAIGTLAGGIAHDFNNILGAIIGFAEIAGDCIPPESEATQYLSRVQGAAHRAAALVKQILAFSRQANIERIPLKPVHIIKEAIKLLRPSLPSTITIKHDINSSTRSIFADPTQVHQILMNLCTNAFHAMEQTGGTLGIILNDCEISREDLQQRPEIQPGKFVLLSIGDTGLGIEAVILDKIFEPYFTTKEVGKGTGMGLAISHGIVASYGGFIACESEIGRGTVFRVYFPAIEEVTISEVKPVEVVASSGKERILLIDDEQMLVDLGKGILERLGYEVTALTSSLEALTIFQNQPDHFDAIITDQTMPGITGIDLARQILQIRPDIPIILCTGYSSLIDEEKAKSEGIKGFLEKPMTKKGIVTLLRKVLDAK